MARRLPVWANTIAKAVPTINTATTAGEITYGQTLANSNLTGGTANVSGDFAWKDPTVAPAVSDSQKTEYDVVFTPKDENYDKAECKVKLTVNKTATTITKAPEAKALTYTGSAKELVTAGTATGGEMQYALGTATEATEPYTTSIPAKTNAETYFVWYKVEGDAGHLDTEPECVRASIAKADVAKAEVVLKRTSYAYDGTAKEPAVKSVTLGGKKLKAGRDYAVSYKSNKKLGTATAIVTGTGNYKGAAKAAFEIVLSKAKISTVGDVAKLKFTASWAKVAGAKGYELQWRKAGGKWRTVTVKGASKAVSGLKEGKFYHLRVRAVAGERVGAWSKVSRRYLRSVKGVRATVKKAGTVTATWKADPEADLGYVVKVRYEKGGAVVATASVAAGATRATVKGLGPGRALWVQVRPMRMRTVDGSTYTGVLHGAWAE